MSEYLSSVNRETNMPASDRLTSDSGVNAHERFKSLVPKHFSQTLADYIVMSSMPVTSIPGVVFVLFLGKNHARDTLVVGWVRFDLSRDKK